MSGDTALKAAYLVFFLILLVYFAIMALRLSRMQRDLDELQSRRAAQPDAAEERPEEVRTS